MWGIGCKLCAIGNSSQTAENAEDPEQVKNLCELGGESEYIRILGWEGRQTVLNTTPCVILSPEGAKNLIVSSENMTLRSAQGDKSDLLSLARLSEQASGQGRIPTTEG